MDETPETQSANSTRKINQKLMSMLFGVALISAFLLIVINMSAKSGPKPEKELAKVSASKTYPNGLVVTAEVRSIDGAFEVKILATNTGTETLNFQGLNGCSRFNLDILNSIRTDLSEICTQALIDDELPPGEEISSGDFTVQNSEIDGNCISVKGRFYQYASKVAESCATSNKKAKSKVDRCQKNPNFIKECTQLLVWVGYDGDEEATLELAQYALKRFGLAVITQEKYYYDYTIDSQDRETCEVTKEPVYDLWSGKFYANISKDQAKSVRAEINKQITLNDERRFQAESEDASDRAIAVYKANRLFIHGVEIEPLDPEVFEYDSTDC